MISSTLLRGLEQTTCRESGPEQPAGDAGLLLNSHSMSTNENSRWERRTWPEIKRLAAEVPEAGIHFQSECAPESGDVSPR